MRRRSAAVFGAGIAGLTVAHELARRGWVVTVYEVNDHVGGFFRSIRVDRPAECAPRTRGTAWGPVTTTSST